MHRYGLYGVVVHQGKISSGHYIAYVKSSAAAEHNNDDDADEYFRKAFPWWPTYETQDKDNTHTRKQKHTTPKHDYQQTEKHF